MFFRTSTVTPPPLLLGAPDHSELAVCQNAKNLVARIQYMDGNMDLFKKHSSWSKKLFLIHPDSFSAVWPYSVKGATLNKLYLRKKSEFAQAEPDCLCVAIKLKWEKKKQHPATRHFNSDAWLGLHFWKYAVNSLYRKLVNAPNWLN